MVEKKQQQEYKTITLIDQNNGDTYFINVDYDMEIQDLQKMIEKQLLKQQKQAGIYTCHLIYRGKIFYDVNHQTVKDFFQEDHPIITMVQRLIPGYRRNQLQQFFQDLYEQMNAF